jgi:acetate kinase
VFNAGSSSLKFGAWRVADRGAEPELLLRRTADSAGEGISEALRWLLQQHEIAPIVAVGHRVVHGGAKHAVPIRIDERVLVELEGLVPLAPLHQPQGLAAVREVARALPEAIQVACFDTAFHRSQPAVAQSYSLPAALRERSLCRYGFHGLSCEHALRVLRESAPEAIVNGRVIIAHLGAGASLTAVQGGHSIATTMGFTPLDGLPMASRCGGIDPGVLLYLLRNGFDVDSLERLLYRESGLLGLSGTSGDMRALLASEAQDPAARFAIEYFIYRAMREAGSLAAALCGLDCLVFTGGIGEHQPRIRERLAAGLAWLGVQIDPAANERGDTIISSKGSRVLCRLIAADEESVIAKATARLLQNA